MIASETSTHARGALVMTAGCADDSEADADRKGQCLSAQTPSSSIWQL